MATVYTTGYGGRTRQQVVEATRAVNGVLVDIRYAPYSQREGYNGSDFRRAMGDDEYVWLKHFGNKNYQGGPIELVDFERGVHYLDKILATGRPAVLMCACGRLDHCHRKVVAQLLQNIGFDVAELPYAPAPARPTPPTWSQDKLPF